MAKDGETMVTDFIFLGFKITADGDCSHGIKRHLLLGRKVMTNLDTILKSRHYFANKGPFSQSCGVSSNQIWMCELDHKESWMLKNWCFWTVALENTLESPLDCKEITFIKRLFSSSSLSAIRVVSSAYLRLLIFFPTIFIPACASSSPAFLMMWVTIYSLDVLLFLFGTSLLFHVQF